MERRGPNRLDFMMFPIIPLKVWELPMEKARFNKIYDWRVPEHHWFNLFSTSNWTDFLIESSYEDRRTTTEEGNYYKEM